MTTPITKEQAQRLRNDFECWQQDYDPVADKEQFDMFGLGMIAMDALLAAMDAEPVAYADPQALINFKNDEGKITARTREWMWRRPGEDLIPLYATPPALVVNAEPVADVVAWHKEGEERTCDIRWRRFDVAPGPLFAVAQPVANVPTFDEWLEMRGNKPLGWVKDAMRESYDACRAAMLNHSENERGMVEPVSQPYKLPEEKGASLQLRNLIRKRHAEWSDATFGNVGPIGPLKHLSKEALEAAAEPDDLSEWADMQFLLWDAQRRAGIRDGEITAAMEEKLKVNMARQWPEPKDGEPRMHIKEPGNSPAIQDDWQLVPVDATLDMLKEGAKQNMKNESFQSVWKAMLAAAPQQEGK